MPSHTARPLQGALAGVGAGLLGALAMDGATRLWAAARHGPPGPTERPLLHQGTRPDVDDAQQRARETGAPAEVATTRVAAGVASAVAGHPLSPPQRQRAGQAVHYGFSALAGAAYGAAVECWPVVGVGRGVPFGAVVWLGAVEVALPALGLMDRPTRYTAGQHAFSLAGHVLYGLVTETARRGLRR